MHYLALQEVGYTEHFDWIGFLQLIYQLYPFQKKSAA